MTVLNISIGSKYESLRETTRSGYTFVSFVATCQTRTVWSFEQLAINSPQGLTLAIRTHSLCPVNVLTQYPVATSHILMVLSLEALTTKSPCGTNATELTLWSCPCMVFTQANDWWKSHNLIDMSALHETNSFPETSKETSCTLSVCPFNVLSNSPLSKSHTCGIKLIGWENGDDDDSDRINKWKNNGTIR